MSEPLHSKGYKVLNKSCSDTVSTTRHLSALLSERETALIRDLDIKEVPQVKYQVSAER